jgi:hypothetical protein
MISGCIEEEVINSSEIKQVSLKDLGDNLNNYIGKNITTQGFIKNGKGENISQLYVISLCDSNSSNPDYCCLLYVPTDVIIYSGYYQINGIVGVQTNLTIPKIEVFSAKLLS